jgi:hypothetical protein
LTQRLFTLTVIILFFVNYQTITTTDPLYFRWYIFKKWAFKQ